MSVLINLLSSLQAFTPNSYPSKYTHSGNADASVVCISEVDFVRIRAYCMYAQGKVQLIRQQQRLLKVHINIFFAITLGQMTV